MVVWTGSSEQLRKALRALDRGVGGKYERAEYPGCFFQVRGAEEATLELITTNGHRAVWVQLAGEGYVGGLSCEDVAVRPKDMLAVLDTTRSDRVRLDWRPGGEVYLNEKPFPNVIYKPRPYGLDVPAKQLNKCERRSVARGELLEALNELRVWAKELAREETQEAQARHRERKAVYLHDKSRVEQAHRQVKAAREAVNLARAQGQPTGVVKELKEAQAAALGKWRELRHVVSKHKAKLDEALAWRKNVETRDATVVLSSQAGALALTLRGREHYGTRTLPMSGAAIQPTNVNLRYLIDAVQATEGVPVVDFLWEHNAAALGFTTASDWCYTALVMPLRPD